MFARKIHDLSHLGFGDLIGKDTAFADAVMMMDLRNTTALMFRNTMSGELNMVYRRDDGNIGWVEPNGSEAESK